MITSALFASADNFGESYILEVVALVFIVAFVWRKFPVPWLRTAMQAQREKIGSQLAAGEEARAAAERIVAQRRADVEAAQQEALLITQQATTSAAQLIEDGRRRGEDEYARLVARAATEIELARARARDDVTTRIAQIVIAAAESVVEAELDGPLHHQLIDEAIGAAEVEGR